jgi:hypothetical protein
MNPLDYQSIQTSSSRIPWTELRFSKYLTVANALTFTASILLRYRSSPFELRDILSAVLLLVGLWITAICVILSVVDVMFSGARRGWLLLQTNIAIVVIATACFKSIPYNSWTW